MQHHVSGVWLTRPSVTEKMSGPSCHWSYTKKGGCSLAQGRRTKEDEGDVGLVAGHQEQIEECWRDWERKWME